MKADVHTIGVLYRLGVSDYMEDEAVIGGAALARKV